MKDIPVSGFAETMTILEKDLPVTNTYGRPGPGAWYTCQKEHMIDWFLSQQTNGAGKYTRKTPNQSSRAAYNHLVCLGALIWMAEALGEDPKILREAAAAATAVTGVRAQCAAFRKLIPFDRILELYQSPEGWHRSASPEYFDDPSEPGGDDPNEPDNGYSDNKSYTKYFR